VERRELETGATAKLYETPNGRRIYHLEPLEREFDDAAVATLAAARRELATGIAGGDRAPGRAVRRVADEGAPVEALARVLEKHTRGFGVFDDLFADPRLSDAFVTAPAPRNPIRVAIDGKRLPTNARLTPTGAAALASRLRRASGRSFSRASPTIDAVIEPGGSSEGERVRVAGVTDPASDGLAFAFRRHGAEPWTLPGLVANDTLSADAAALLSLAVERGSAGLVAGTRGAGKTTLLGALLFELPTSTRTVVIEDAPELPVEALSRRGRDVQSLRVSADPDAPFSPTEALRTALRLGEGALVVGEVRGEEAATLYEAMRVGAGGSAVLGTIHGDGGEAVRERVVSDLGVPESSFGATDFLVTLSSRPRGVARIEEIQTGRDGVRFEPLYERGPDGLSSTDLVDRGESALVADLCGASERYADVRSALAERRERIDRMATTDRSRVRDVVAAVAAREREA
jgi:type IV secretory pathway ATPase VirB11/archaellum biosynthesis ATPase